MPITYSHLENSNHEEPTFLHIVNHAFHTEKLSYESKWPPGGDVLSTQFIYKLLF